MPFRLALHGLSLIVGQEVEAKCRVVAVRAELCCRSLRSEVALALRALSPEHTVPIAWYQNTQLRRRRIVAKAQAAHRNHGGGTPINSEQLHDRSSVHAHMAVPQ